MNFVKKIFKNQFENVSIFISLFSLYGAQFFLTYFIGFNFSPTQFSTYVYYTTFFGFFKIIIDFGTNTEIFVILKKNINTYLNQILIIKLFIFFSFIIFFSFYFYFVTSSFTNFLIFLLVCLASFIDFKIYTLRYFSLFKTLIKFSLSNFLLVFFSSLICFYYNLDLAFFILIIILFKILLFINEFLKIKSFLNYLNNYKVKTKLFFKSGSFLVLSLFSYAYNSIDILFLEFFSPLYYDQYIFALKSLVILIFILDILNFKFFLKLKDKIITLKSAILIYFIAGFISIFLYLIIINLFYTTLYEKFYLDFFQLIPVVIPVIFTFINSILGFKIILLNKKIVINILFVSSVTIIYLLSVFAADAIGIYFLFIGKLLVFILMSIFLITYGKFKYQTNHHKF